jgi:eukaryotic-like serine/threonine-protein kinase
MASGSDDPGDDREDRLDALTADILQAIRNRGDVDPADWINRHPEFAAELEAFFQDTSAAGRFLEPSLVSANAPGDHFGPYCLVRVIGKGGMGVVHEAVDEETGALCALKLLLASTLHDPRSLARFRREAAVLAGLER